MDAIVEAALRKWPHVPHCYGWLALDARGHWYMRDERIQAAGPFPRIKGSRIEHEKLRDEWAAAPSLDARREVAKRMNRNMHDYVHDVKTGQWVAPVAYRADRLRGFLPVPEVLPWWNVERIG